MVLRNSFPGFMKVFPKIFFQAPQEVERLSTDRKVSGSLPGSSCQHVEEILGEILNPDSPPHRGVTACVEKATVTFVLGTSIYMKTYLTMVYTLSS